MSGRWLLLSASVLALLAGLVTGCSSGPSYCPAATVDAANLTVDASHLGHGSVQDALNLININAMALNVDAKAAYPSQVTAIQDSITTLQAAIKSQGATAPAITQVQNAVSSLQHAVPHGCTFPPGS